MQLTRRQMLQRGGMVTLGITLPLSGLSAQPASSQVKIHMVEIRRFAFVPAVVTIKAGQIVEWVNSDFAPHTVTADSTAWDTGELEKTARAQQSFDQPGAYSYFCAFHPHMRGTVIVTA